MVDRYLLEKLFAVTKIPLQYSVRDQCVYYSGGFDPNPASLMIQCAIHSAHNLCYTAAYEHQHLGMVRVLESEGYVLVGPVMALDCTRNQARRILADLQQPLNRADELLLFLNGTPLCDQQRFYAMLTFLDYLFNGAANHEVTQIPYVKSTEIMPVQQSAPDFIEHMSSVIERDLVSCVEYGRPEQLNVIFEGLESGQSGGVPMVAVDVIRAYKNILLFSIGVVSRAALQGGLEYDTVNMLTTQFLKQVEIIDNQEKLYKLFKQIFLDFARRTSRARSSLSHTAVVKNISKIVLSRIYEKTTPAIIAENLGMNVSYLCTHFKRETGQTISEYVNEIKVSECKRLLESTDMPLAQISEQLGYSSQNYLNTVFKKITGSTPMEYRRSCV